MSDPFGLPTRRPKQKTYGKAVKSHVVGWFGSKLWTEKESEDAREGSEGQAEKKVVAKKSAYKVVKSRERVVVSDDEDDDDTEEIIRRLEKVRLERETTVEKATPSAVDITPEDCGKNDISDVIEVKSRDPEEKTVRRKKTQESVRERRKRGERQPSETSDPDTNVATLGSEEKENKKPLRKKKSSHSTRQKDPVIEIPETPYPDRTASPEPASPLVEEKPRRTRSQKEGTRSKARSSRSKKKEAEKEAEEPEVKETPVRKQVLAAVEISTPAKPLSENAKTPAEKPAPKPKKRLAATQITTSQSVVPQTPQPEQKTPKRIAPVVVSPLVASVEPRRGSVKKKPPSPSPSRLFTPRELPRYKAPSEEYNEKITLQENERLEDAISISGPSEETKKAKTRSKARPKRIQPTLVTVEETSAPKPTEPLMKMMAVEIPTLKKTPAREPEPPRSASPEKPAKKRATLVSVEIASSPASFKTAEENFDDEPLEGEWTEADQAEFDAKLETLLKFCTKPEVIDFTKYIQKLERESVYVKKLGEASFSEVFVKEAKGGKQTVIKVIPFGGEDQCQIDEILQEVKITHMMSSFDGYISFNGAVVSTGFYPESLIDMWDDYADAKGTENDRPDFYEEDQLYAIILLEHGGRDLEHFDLTSWVEAADVFWQVVEILAVGEEKAEFEHRDLHWGNIVIRRESGGPKKKDTKKPLHELISSMDINSAGTERLKVSLIDYTLSRARLPTDSTPTYTPLSDPALFTGKGDYQFDIYRFMRRHFQSTYIPNPNSTSSDSEEQDLDETGKAWAEFRPKTNLFWLHYLLNILLNKKGIKRPGGGRRAGNVDESEEKAYRDLEAVSKRIDPRKKRWASNAEEMEIASASDLWRWAREEGYVH